jgi:hypothetical protein
VLLDAFQTVILPGRRVGRLRITRLFFLVPWYPWTGLAGRSHSRRSPERLPRTSVTKNLIPPDRGECADHKQTFIFGAAEPQSPTETLVLHDTFVQWIRCRVSDSLGLVSDSL